MLAAAARRSPISAGWRTSTAHRSFWTVPRGPGRALSGPTVPSAARPAVVPAAEPAA